MGSDGDVQARYQSACQQDWIRSFWNRLTRTMLLPPDSDLPDSILDLKKSLLCFALHSADADYLKLAGKNVHPR